MAFVGLDQAVLDFIADARLPLGMSFGARGSHFEFLNRVIRPTSGWRERNLPRDQALGFWRLRQEILDGQERQSAHDLLAAMRGRFAGTRMRDWSDFSVADQTLADINLGADPDGQTDIQLIKSYSAGSATYVRTITLPVDPATWTDETFLDGTAADFVLEKNGNPLTGGGTDYSVDFSTGVVTLTSALVSTDVLTWASGLFHVPVTLASDEPDWEIVSAAGDDELRHFWNIDLEELPR